MIKKNRLIWSEVREDKIHDRFVIIAPGRSKRPHSGKKQKDTCVFCSKEVQFKVLALYQVGKGKDWLVKVIKNIYPVVDVGNPKAYGYHEVVIETREHKKEMGDLPIDHLIAIMEAYIARTKELAKDKKIKYILIFKNQGGSAGASLAHAHSQIFASSFVPPHIIDKLTKAQEYRIEHGNCYYCDLLKKEEKGPRFIMSDEYALAFTPYASIYAYEAWIMPKKHVDNITVLDRDEIASMAVMIKQLTEKLNKEGIPYNMFLHQSITDKDEHFYIRICPRRDIWAGLETGSRLIVNPVSPEEAAKFYRKRHK
ncbi:DUF4931 domain-containing protein [Candidatus Kuenenbacteria bacterium]|nr:DUF4931 domain-containing protein [Candidatus Kuenenbacteria bacterium]